MWTPSPSTILSSGTAGVLMVCAASGMAVFLIVGLLVTGRRRSREHAHYPALLIPRQTVKLSMNSAPCAVPSSGGGGLRQSPSFAAAAVQHTSWALSPHSLSNSTCSLASSLSSGDVNNSLCSSTVSSRRVSLNDLPQKRGDLHFAVSYEPLQQALQIRLIECRDLPEIAVGSAGQCLLDPYVKVQLLPDRSKVKTRIVRATTKPKYDEDFTFYGIDASRLQEMSLHFAVVAFDKYSRDTTIAEALFPLEEAWDQLAEGATLDRELALSGEMLESAHGQLLLAVSYHNAFHTLTVVVLKARNLVSTTPDSSTDPFVKVTLRDQGNKLAKRKTQSRRCTSCPVFNESLAFELPEGRWETLEVDAAVWQADGRTLIGRAVLNAKKGALVEALANPGKQVINWHCLH